MTEARLPVRLPTKGVGTSRVFGLNRAAGAQKNGSLERTTPKRGEYFSPFWGFMPIALRRQGNVAFERYFRILESDIAEGGNRRAAPYPELFQCHLHQRI